RCVVVGIGTVSVVYSTWLLGGNDVGTAFTAGLRIVVLALPGAVLSAFVDPARLSDQLGQRLRLPARFVVAFSAALQRFERLGLTWQQLARARRARGFGPTRGPVSRFRYAASLTFGLLVASLRAATNMSIAMDARGFVGAHTRTWAEPAPWTRTDTAVLALGVALAAVPVALYLSA
ncbi:MAG: energy-coupling factor transporter transmembrane component T, partial [Nocardioidaceae bacterium]